MDVKMEDDFSFHTWGNLRFWLFKVNQIHGGVESQKIQALIRVMTGHENMTCEWYLHNNMKSHLFQDFGSFKQVQFLINLQSNGPTKNAERSFCPLLSLPKCTESSPLFATPWIQWLLDSCSSQRALMKKKASLILQFRPESNAEIPITSLKSLGRISSRLSQGFSHPHHRQNKKKLANKTIYENVFRFKTSTTSLQPLPFKPPRAIFQVSQKTFPYQNNKTQNNGIHTPKKHTKIQTKQNIQNTNPNKTKFQTKQNSDSKQTPPKKNNKQIHSNKFQTQQTQANKKKHKPF